MKVSYSSVLLVLGLGALAWFSGVGCEAKNDVSDNNGQGDADSDSDSDSDGDGDMDTDGFDDDDDDDDNDDNDNDDNGDTDPNSDFDNDGFTDNEGDCNDGEPLINPDAMEDLGDAGTGDNVDNDCDGEVDEIEAECDVNPVGTTAADLAAAMNLCDGRFLKKVEQIHTTNTNFEKAYDTLDKQGNNNCLVHRQGAEMAAISTGPVGQANPNNAVPLGDAYENEANDPMPDYQGDEQNTAEIEPSCDVSQIRLELKAPANAVGFSFDFLFGSSEYDEWINKSFNDTFYAIMEYAALNGGATTNISFDLNNNEIEVDVNFFEDEDFPCDESGSGWEPEVEMKSGSTGWLRTTKSLENPGDEFVLTFSIHDEGDCLFDSITFIDNFRWWTSPVEEDETIIIVVE
jgi:hypothetical protein